MKIKIARRGLSTIIGAVFMVIVMIGALNVTLWTMQQQDSIADVVAEKTTASIDRLNERIDISDVKIEDDKFNLTVSNSGGRTTELGSLYLVNESATPKEQYRYDLSGLVVDSRQSVSGIGTDSGVPFTVDTSDKYTAKVVTMSGNSAAMRIAPPGELDLKMDLYVIPPTITNGQDVTLLFAVTNDSTDSLAYAVTPVITIDLSCTPYPSENCNTTEITTAESDVFIPKGATYLFKQVYNVEGPVDTIITFTATLQNADPGSEVTETGRIVVVDLASQSSYTEIIVSSTLVQQPGIFLTIPAPFGESADNNNGLWGVTVVNPTEVTMEVSRLVISTISPHSPGSQKIFEKNCHTSDVFPIYPSTAAEWRCEEDNQLEWKDVVSPETIDPLSSKSFLVRIEPGNLGASTDEPAFMISVTVYTNMGQFSSVGYSSGMEQKPDGPIVNVYLTDTTTESTAMQDAHIFAHKNSLPSNTQVTLYVAVADLDTSSGTHFKSGGRLIINVPRGFADVALASYSGFSGTPTITPYSDTSTQIVATLASDLGDQSSKEGRVLSFTATTPTVPESRIFIMHILADGQTDTNFSVGAFSQIALQVVP